MARPSIQIFFSYFIFTWIRYYQVWVKNRRAAYPEKSKNDQYPKSLDDAIFAIGGMKFDKEYYDQHKKQCKKRRRIRKLEKRKTQK